MMVAIFSSNISLNLSQPFRLHILSGDNWSNVHNSAIELAREIDNSQGDAIGVNLSQPFRLFLTSSIGEAFGGGKSLKGSDRYSLRHRRRIGSCAIIMSLKGSDIFHHSSKNNYYGSITCSSLYSSKYNSVIILTFDLFNCI